MKRTRRRSKSKPLLYIESVKPPVVPITSQNIYRFRIEPEYEPVSNRPQVEVEKRKVIENLMTDSEKKETAIAVEEQITEVIEEEQGSPVMDEVNRVSVGVLDAQSLSSPIEENIVQPMDAKSAIEELKKSATKEETQVSGVGIGNRDDLPKENKLQVIQETGRNQKIEQEKEALTNVVDEEERELTEEEIRQIELKKLIRRLAVFPRVLERPYCEATIQGKKRIVQILSKRGNKVRVKYRNNQIEAYDIGDFEDLKILAGDRD